MRATEMARQIFSRFLFLLLPIVFVTSTPVIPIRQASAAATLAPGRTDKTIPGAYFGIHIHRAGTSTPWPEAPPFRTWRLWDSYTSWRNLETQKGLWQFAKLDSYVAMAESSGVDILLPLGSTPTWASARPNETAMYGKGHAAEPAQIQDWRDYVRTVATRYKGRIRYYEIWNEPNLKSFYSGTTAKMVELTKEASAIIREVDPAAKVVGPSPTGSYGVGWFNSFLAKGGGQYVDILAYHFYVTPKVPEKMLPIITRVMKVRNRHGLQDKPVWNTETGWTFPDNLNLSEQGLASYLTRSFVINWASGVDRFYWYSWDAGKNGVVQVNGLVRTPATDSFDRTVEWLQGARMVDFRKTGKGIYIAEINRDDGYRGWIVWKASGKPASLAIPDEWNAKRVRTLDGITDTVAGLTSYVVGTSPVIIDTIEY